MTSHLSQRRAAKFDKRGQIILQYVDLAVPL